jgi:hypothetical protein
VRQVVKDGTDSYRVDSPDEPAIETVQDLELHMACSGLR